MHIHTFIYIYMYIYREREVINDILIISTSNMLTICIIIQVASRRPFATAASTCWSRWSAKTIQRRISCSWRREPVTSTVCVRWLVRLLDFM